MENNFKVNMNEYLPLRDVVFNTLRQAILKGELAPADGNSAGLKIRRQQDSDQGSYP